MKNIVKGALISGLSLIALGALAAVPQDTSKFSTKVKKGTTKAAHATAKAAVKAESAVVDKVYSGKQGPNGATIYINKHDRCYYVNSKGGKVYIKKSALRNKPTS
ncbi:hypothetical protein BEL04_17920 [Mucilaginibacter sp. PPCGB 2223]|uniref:hypothetical protein n=1 Tax=Mucilaginibacter sp. PPCGB 2223 TaxID=1886027 RepID=UPI0008268E16|nr:hypothetical protein [Mucilaginibacter sp. PPCGB 2223]OCX51881.1 hypothetical protein BEL04_17920 [Mucilaginibacter sp. PPCGB 2223]